MPHPIMPGAIIDYSWGFDQTNREFFEVVSTTAHFVTLRPLASKMERASGDMAGYFEPCPGQYLKGKETRHKVSIYSGSPSIHFRYGSARIWDGTPKFASWYA